MATETSQFPIELCLIENLFRSAGHAIVYRTIRNPEKLQDTRLWGQDIEQWTGKAFVYGEMIDVFGWCHKGSFPKAWHDYRE